MPPPGELVISEYSAFHEVITQEQINTQHAKDIERSMPPATIFDFFNDLLVLYVCLFEMGLE
jgi:phospholipid N-methyltransferase